MRVLLLNESARRHNGGMNRVVVETCDWLGRAGHAVHLAFTDGGPVETVCPASAIPRERARTSLLELADRFVPDVIQVHHVTDSAMLDDLAHRWPLAVFLHDQTWFCAGGDRADATFAPCHRAHGPGCLIWNYLQGCGGRNPVGNWQRWRRTDGFMNLRSLRPIRVQVASRFMRQGLLENGYGDDRVDVIPLFAEPPPAVAETEPGLILLPSRLVRPKGVGLAIDALARLRSHSWRLVVAGDGLNRDEFISQVHRLGLEGRVQFEGEIIPERLGEWYARSQLVLFPVLRSEPFGLVGVESLAYGKPIVALAGGAVDEWLWPGETGLRVEERSLEAFAVAIRELLLAPARCREMGEAARRRYPYFHPSAYVDRLVDAFERTVRWHRESARADR